MKIYRQGDILIKEIKEIPKDIKKENHRILAHGEATGHTHRLESGNLFSGLAGLIYLILEEETRLIHEEHEPILLPEGNYEVVRQKEYTPERIRYVQD